MYHNGLIFLYYYVFDFILDTLGLELEFTILILDTTITSLEYILGYKKLLTELSTSGFEL